MPVTDQSSLNPHKSITPDVDLMLDFVFQGGGVDYKKQIQSDVTTRLTTTCGETWRSNHQFSDRRRVFK
ncbi:hypothetical protein YC2023_122831 [Brassica napus]